MTSNSAAEIPYNENIVKILHEIKSGQLEPEHGYYNLWRLFTRASSPTSGAEEQEQPKGAAQVEEGTNTFQNGNSSVSKENLPTEQKFTPVSAENAHTRGVQMDADSNESDDKWSNSTTLITAKSPQLEPAPAVQQEDAKEEDVRPHVEKLLANNIDGLQQLINDDDLFYFYKGVVIEFGIGCTLLAQSQLVQKDKRIAEAFDKGYLRGAAEAGEKHWDIPVPKTVLNKTQYLASIQSGTVPPPDEGEGTGFDISAGTPRKKKDAAGD